jgi:hypothetical protein
MPSSLTDPRRLALLQWLGPRERTPRDDRHRPEEKARLRAAFLCYDLVTRECELEAPK